MGVLMRRRSLLIKLVVVVSTAWFTIAFLLYSEHQTTEPAVAERLEGNEVNKRDLEEVAQKIGGLVKEKKSQQDSEEDRQPINDAVLQPPLNQPGEMGKPVSLPANMSAKVHIIIDLVMFVC
ncbi:hypothetical protein MML48_8g00007614 [Holotrichia oblita]|uniref:Uncharacterized protein n=1 Tax=Holotrichia oblita TaxID=644536 RepID=A0ACB9SLB2_HOLOL|nr:hypothetical protein MML48_8g00007614 [Holotrichia oblita]